MNGYNFTERVRKCLAMAREESARLRHEYVGTEHILLGLVREGGGVAVTVLQNLEVDLDELRGFIDETVKKGSAGARGSDLPYTSRAKKTLELAMSEARHMNHAYVGTEHLLLGLLAERQGIAAQVLIDRGVTLQNAREETLRVLGRPNAPTDDAGQIVAWRKPQRQPPPPQPPSQRLAEVLDDTRNVATELYAAEVMPIHLAIALIRHGEGMANAVVDRLGFDRGALLRALEAEAKASAPSARPEQPARIGEAARALQQHVEAEARWRSSSPSTLDALLALLDTQKDVASIFGMQAIDANRVRTEAKRMSG